MLQSKWQQCRDGISVLVAFSQHNNYNSSISRIPPDHYQVWTLCFTVVVPNLTNTV